MLSKSANIVDSYKNIPIRTCNTWKKIRKLVRYIKQTGHCSFDFETNAEPPYQDSFFPTIVGISFQPGARYMIPLNHYESPFRGGEWLAVLGYLNDEVFSNPDIIKYAHNAKFELGILMKYGFNIKGQLFDTMLAKHLLDENTRNGLKDVIVRLIPEYANYDQELVLIRREHGSWKDIPMRPLGVYCCMDTDLTLRLHLLLERRLFDAPKLYKLYRNLCMMNTRVLAESEMLGMEVNTKYLDKITKDQGKLIEDNLAEITSHPRILKFEKWRRKEHVKKLIAEVEKDIESIIDKEGENEKTRKKIQFRQDKISRYIAGELQTKKEMFESFNMNSTKQLVEFLYTSPKGLRLDIIAYTRDKNKQETDNPSTNEETLLQLKDQDSTGFIEKLLKHREWSKLHSTYMVGIQEKVNRRTSKVHGRFLIHGTVTGRLSSREPNLQNIPRDTTSSLIKRMFTPPKGYLLVEIDYSQAELRYIAEVSKDKDMIAIFARGYNIHLATGLKINGYSLDKYYDLANEVRKDPNHKDFKKWTKVHKSGKVMNFSILYQQGDPMTADSLGVSIEEAQRFKEEWYEQFPGIKSYLERWINKTYKLGYAENIFGRRRRLADIKLRDYAKADHRARGKYNKATRDCINAPIQGGSSDYTQAAAIEIWERRMRGEKPFIYGPYQAYTVHDSIGYYCRPEHIHEFVPAIVEVATKPILKKYYGFEFKKVDMKVSAEVGHNWGEKAEYDPEKDYQTYYHRYYGL